MKQTNELNLSALPILSADQLLKRVSIDTRLNDWRTLMAFHDTAFNDLIQSPFFRYVEAIQLCPASEADHHAGPGGLLAHTYDVISLALKRRRGLQLPLGGTVEQIRDQRHLWTYAIFAAGLLHDIGKLMGSIRICLRFRNNTFMLWTPQDKPLKEFDQAVSYSVEFIKTPYSYHTQIALTLFDFLPQTGRAWLARDQTIMMQLCAYLRGDRFESGVIGEVLEQADMSSTAAAQLRPAQLRFSNRPSTIERLIHFVRQWIAEDVIRINKNGGMAWCTGEYIYIVCRALADKIIKHCDDANITDLPRDPVRLYDIFQDYGFAVPTPDAKAIWNVVISCPEYTHRFTCLKFKLRRLVVPTRIPAPFVGEIKEVFGEAKKQKPIPTTAVSETIPESADSIVAECEEADAITLDNAAESNSSQEGGGDEPIEAAQEIEQETTHSLDDPELQSDQAAVVDKESESNSIHHESEELLGTLGDDSLEDSEEVFSDTIDAIFPDQEADFAETLPETAALEGEVIFAAVAHDEKHSESASDDDQDAGANQETADVSSVKKLQKKSLDKKFGKYLVSGKPSFEPGVVAIDADQVAYMFIRWLRENILNKSIAMNNTEALVHIMEDCVLTLAPGIFKCFLEVHGIDGEANFKALGRKVRLIRKHIPAPDGLNIHPVYAQGKNKTTKLHGWKFPFNLFFDDPSTIPAANIYIKNEPGFTGSKKS